MSEQRFIKIKVEFSTVVPQSVAEISQTKLLKDLVEGVAGGHLKAKITLETVASDVGMADVPEYIRGIWLKRLAQDLDRLAAERKRLDEEIKVDDSGRLAEPFLVWPAGTNLADIEAWFNSVKPSSGKGGKK